MEIRQEKKQDVIDWINFSGSLEELIESILTNTNLKPRQIQLLFSIAIKKRPLLEEEEIFISAANCADILDKVVEAFHNEDLPELGTGVIKQYLIGEGFTVDSVVSEF
ncbi:MAG: hypothetical protein ABI721_01390 [Candidatus Dojkabacteria bacterium]